MATGLRDGGPGRIRRPKLSISRNPHGLQCRFAVPPGQYDRSLIEGKLYQWRPRAGLMASLQEVSLRAIEHVLVGSRGRPSAAA